MTKWIQDRANELLRENNAGVKRMPFAAAMKAATTHQEDFVLPYVNDLQNVIDMEAIRAPASSWAWTRSAALRGPTGSRSTPSTTWTSPSSTRSVDPTFSFMTVDHDGKIRMDCSSPYAMAGLVGLKDQYRVAFANDPDADRHGIVTRRPG